MTASRQTRLAILAATVIVAGGAVSMTATAAGAAAPTSETKTFGYTGAEQSFVVPAGVTSIEVSAIGGSGAAAENTSIGASKGGQGAQVDGSLAVTPGSTLYVEVGGNGTLSAGGFNGGGFSSPPFAETPGGGGGATDIRTSPCGSTCPGTTTSLGSRLIVAGGGGGGGATGNPAAPGGAKKGGNGGASDHAGAGSGVVNGPTGGNHGSATVPGAGGTGGSYGGQSGVGGSSGQGGNGGAEYGGGGAGGGGGGGYYGGGGGGGGGVTSDGTEIGGGGGGGGGSMTPAGGSITFPSGATASVTITYQVPPPGCTVTPHIPTRLSITAATKDYSATITGCTGDLGAANVDLSRVGGSSSEKYGLVFTGDGTSTGRTAHFTVLETDGTGSYQTTGGGGATKEGGTLTWNSASSSLRYGSWTSISTSRKSTKVTITTAVSRYVPGQGRVHYAGRLMTFQARHSVDAGWTTVGYARTGATGRASLTHTSGLVNYYRVVLTDISTVWGSTSGTSHR